MNSGRGNTREGSEDSKKKFDRHSLFVVNVRVSRIVGGGSKVFIREVDEDHETVPPPIKI